MSGSDPEATQSTTRPPNPQHPDTAATTIPVPRTPRTPAASTDTPAAATDVPDTVADTSTGIADTPADIADTAAATTAATGSVHTGARTNESDQSGESHTGGHMDESGETGETGKTGESGESGEIGETTAEALAVDAAPPAVAGNAAAVDGEGTETQGEARRRYLVTIVVEYLSSTLHGLRDPSWFS